MKYNPEITCLFVGGQIVLDIYLLEDVGGRDGKSGLLDASLLLGRRPVPLSRQPAHQRAQGWSRRKAWLRLFARRRRELPAAVPGHQLRMGHWDGRAAQSRHRVPGLGRLLPRPPAAHRNRRALRHPGGPAPGPIPCPLRPVLPRRATLRCAQVCAGRKAAVSGPAAGAAAWGATRTRPAAGRLGAVRAAGPVQPTCGSSPVFEPPRPRRPHRLPSAQPLTPEITREADMRGNIGGALWRSGVFVVVCLVGALR